MLFRCDYLRLLHAGCMEVANIPGMLEETLVANLNVAWNMYFTQRIITSKAAQTSCYDAKVDESK